MSPHVTRRGFLLALGLAPIAAKAVTAAPPVSPPLFHPSQSPREFFSRGTGKTTRMVEAAMRRCAAEPGRHELFLAATYPHIVTMLEPIVARAVRDLPPHSVTYAVPTRTLTFQNGSRLRLDAATRGAEHHLSCEYHQISLDHAAPLPTDWALLQTRIRARRP